MSIIEAFILGIVQGLTEFIPVSSSGHLVLIHELFGTSGSDLTFDIALHVGTLLALVLFFGRDLWQYAKAIIVKSEHTRLSWLLIMATIPAAVIGFLLESAAESAFRSSRLVAVNLIIFGLIMFVAERLYENQKRHTSLNKLSRNQALAVGFAQALAIVPGVSRSGSTITMGMFAGLDRVAATRFSFLLGVPIIAGASLKVLTGASSNDMAGQIGVFLVGVVTAFASGLFAIRFMLNFLSNHGLTTFAYYRVALGLIILLLAML